MKDNFKIDDMGIIIVFIIFYAIFYQYISAGGIDHVVKLLDEPDALSKAVNATLSSVPASEAPVKISVYGPTPKKTVVSTPYEPRTHSIRMDTNGFYPNFTIINVTDTVVWSNLEFKRPRVIFISKENLFEKKYMIDGSRYEYRFDKKGNYLFVLAQDITSIEYPNAKGTIVVN